MMPKLDLSALKAAKGAAGHIKAMKGAGWSWNEPAAGLPTALRLDAAAHNVACTITDAGPNSISIYGPINTRRSYMFPVAKWPQGTRIKFNWSGGNLWTRTSNDNTGTTNIHSITAGVGSSGNVDYVISNNNSFAWFGFLVAGDRAASTILITDFQVILP